MTHAQALVDRLSNETLHDLEIARDESDSAEEYQMWEDRIFALEEYIDILLRTNVTETKIA